MRSYPVIKSGARAALVAPAGPLSKGDVERATTNAKTLGWEPVLGDHARDREAYFAGKDMDRLSDLNAALRDDSIDVVWCLRGGYGAMRLLEQVDYAALQRRPKLLIGYSDITALHCAVAVTCELSSVHGPTARSKLPSTSERSLRAAATRDGDPCGDAPDARTLIAGRAQGRLVGGNLALLCALHGTPYQPSYKDAILVVEDVNEAPYRIERMLLQLRLSGALRGCAGIVFGSFTNTGETDDKSLGGSRTVTAVLEEAAKAVNVPTICGAPFGHIDEQWSIPLGSMAELDADARSLRILWE